MTHQVAEHCFECVEFDTCPLVDIAIMVMVTKDIINSPDLDDSIKVIFRVLESNLSYVNQDINENMGIFAMLEPSIRDNIRTNLISINEIAQYLILVAAGKAPALTLKNRKELLLAAIKQAEEILAKVDPKDIQLN